MRDEYARAARAGDDGAGRHPARRASWRPKAASSRWSICATPGFPSNAVRLRLLEEHGVVVAHGSAYGEGGEGTLRVSFASGGENLANGLERLRTGLAAL